MASSRLFEDGAFVRCAIMAAVALAMMGGTISTVPQHPLKPQSEPMADDQSRQSLMPQNRRGVAAVWHSGKLDTRGDARRKRGHVQAVSPKGAIGLMQIMPHTWAGLRLRYQLGRNPRDPRDNIFAGAAYLREMYDRYGAAGFLAAYNAGPGRYAEYLATGRPLPAETLAYVAALAPLIGGDPVNRGVVIAAGATAWIRAPLFAVVADSTSSAYRPQSKGRLRARPVTDLSGLEPSHGWHSRDTLRGASLFVARTSSGPPH